MVATHVLCHMQVCSHFAFFINIICVTNAILIVEINAESSRSHSIFVITVNQKNLIDGSVNSGKLSLVDLAGPEKVCKVFKKKTLFRKNKFILEKMQYN